MIEELIPCPFCDSAVKIRNQRTERTWSGFVVSDYFYIQCSCGIRTKGYRKRSNLVKFWNRRAKIDIQGIQDLV